MNTAEDVKQLAAKLGIDRVDGATPLKPGLGGTELWRLHRDRGDVVLRAFAEAAPPAVARREAIAHELARRHGVPAPAVRAHGTVGGRPVLVMDWVDGPVLAEQLRKTDDPDELGRRCGTLLARLHQITGRPAVISERSWIAWAGDRAAELAPLLQHLPADTLLHLDFHPENLIRAADELVIIDWANVRFGPAAADLARTLSILELIIEAHPEMTEASRDQVRRYRAGLLDGYRSSGGEVSVPGAVMAWAYAVQLHDLTGSWVPDDYFDRLRHKYAAALSNDWPGSQG